MPVLQGHLLCNNCFTQVLLSAAFVTAFAVLFAVVLVVAATATAKLAFFNEARFLD
jgi:hypothetical protein